MKTHQEFEALQQALRDPWPEDYDPAEVERGQRKRSYGWRNEVAAQRVRRLFSQGLRAQASSAQATTS
jgi:ribosomal protein L15E